MTTKKWYDAIDGCRFKMYIPDYRIGFIVNNKEYRAGAFGIVILKLQDKYDIEIIERSKIYELEN